MTVPFDRMLAATLDGWRDYARVNGHELIERDGALTLFTPARVAAFNPTVIYAPQADPAAMLQEIADAYASRGIPFGFEITAGIDAATEAAAKARGMHVLRVMPGMLLHPLPNIDEPATTPRLDIREMTDEDGLQLHLQTQAAGFGDDLDDLKAFAPPTVLKVSRFLLGFVNDVPVATAVLGMTGTVGGIFAVSTRPQNRRNGYGRAMTEAAVRLAAEEGCDLAYLHASDEGFSVYERIGFTTVSRHNIYVHAEDPARA